MADPVAATPPARRSLSAPGQEPHLKAWSVEQGGAVRCRTDALPKDTATVRRRHCEHEDHDDQCQESSPRRLECPAPWRHPNRLTNGSSRKFCCSIATINGEDVPVPDALAWLFAPGTSRWEHGWDRVVHRPVKAVKKRKNTEAAAAT
ncbi:hypothetical protein GCM10009696_06250 [Kocuria himachalensis]